MLDWLYRIPAALAAATQTSGEAPAAGTPGVPSPTDGLLGMLVPMVLIVGVFYFLMIRPQKKKDKKVKDMLANLKVGDRICTIGGIYGTIRGLREDSVVLSVGHQNTEMVFARWAIRNVEEVSVENEGELLT